MWRAIAVAVVLAGCGGDQPDPPEAMSCAVTAVRSDVDIAISTHGTTTRPAWVLIVLSTLDDEDLAQWRHEVDGDFTVRDDIFVADIAIGATAMLQPIGGAFDERSCSLEMTHADGSPLSEAERDFVARSNGAPE